MEYTRKRVGEFIIELDSFIGEGQFGKVYKGYQEATKEVVAVKVISIKDLD
jgi:serine/threonine protein kinase